jgi:signal peptidase I
LVSGKHTLPTALKRLWKNEYFKTVVTIALIPLLVAGFWFGLQAVLKTEIFPLFTVTSGSMCIPNEPCDMFAHTFERTLHVGDLLIIQGVDAKELKTDYPNSDVIVYRNPELPADDPKANIVHRIVRYEDVDGTRYFWTKGDGNGYPNVWPNPAQSTDPWSPISEDYVYGKVVLRIPWSGSLALLAHQFSVIPIILVLIIILLVVLEFVLPTIRKKTALTPSATGNRGN